MVDHFRNPKSPRQHLCGEIISSAKIIESDNVVPRFLFFDAGNCGQNFHSKSLTKPHAFFSINFDKARLNMLLGEYVQVLVYDLASFSCSSVEMTDEPLTFLLLFKEVLFILNFLILPMPNLNPLVFSVPHPFQFFESV